MTLFCGTIDSFSGPHRFLSNFSPAQVTLDGEKYDTVEHAYQAAKTLDLGLRREIQACRFAWEAKRAGKLLDLRPDWEDVKLDIMEALLREKFLKYIGRRTMLAGTKGMLLVEGNTWGDTFWGVCDGVGENHLGKLLMKIRDEIE